MLSTESLANWPKSAGIKPKSVKFKSKHDSFIEKCKRVHGDKFTYENTVFTGYKNKITVTCRAHGDFEQTPNNHVSGAGCMQCHSESKKMTTGEFIARAKARHGTKCTYDNTAINSSRDKAQIDCVKHGAFYQRSDQHLFGQGCPKCARENTRGSSYE